MLPQHTAPYASMATAFHQRFKDLQWDNRAEVDQFTLDLFRWQAESLAVYKEYLEALRVEPSSINHINSIPFMPLSFFKSHTIKSWHFETAVEFSSSTTTGQIPAIHHLADPAFYQQHSEFLFERTYGKLKDWVILALLPSYLERGGSSLVYMIDHFIKRGKHAESGFFLHDYQALQAAYHEAKKNGKKVILWGVSYALLDLAASEYRLALQSEDVLMETGGMKGRRRELIREELHAILKAAFGVQAIHSEYGMTELLSQSYSTGEGIYHAPPSLRVMIRDAHDPFSMLSDGKTGGVNLIDLANIDSCAFLQTQDLGRRLNDGSFEILGRFDHSELRGCNLMAV